MAALALILWGLWFVTYHTGYSEGFHYAEGENYAAEYPSDTDKRIRDCPSPSVEGLKACVEEAVTASHDAQRSERDLNAQRDMADWAWWLLIVSVVTLIVSSFGLFALILTIRQGREALERAREANEIAREGNQRQLRPYVLGEKVSPAITSKLEDRLTIFFRNFGQTPAEKPTLRYGVAYVRNGQNFWPMARTTLHLDRDIAPGHYQRGVLMFDKAWAKLVQEGRGEIRILAILSYEGYGAKEASVTIRIHYTRHGPLTALRKGEDT